MSTGIDELISAEVERSFADEPPLRDPREYAARGRRAQRRRRAASGALGVAVLGVAATLVLGGSQIGGDDGRGVEPAAPGDVVPVRGTEPVPVDPRHQARCDAGRVGACDEDISSDDVYFSRDGRLLRGYAYDEVGGYYLDVLRGRPTDSAAVELTVHGQTVWALVTVDRGARSSGLQYADPDPERTFDEWVGDSVEDGSWFSYAPDPDGPGEGATPR